MKTVGIIAEFNPFHNGHKHIIDTIKQNGDRVVCVIGDDFTQRGDVAIVSKYARAEMALRCGADLCVLMPVPWSMSCASNFALGGVSILKELSVDAIAFGSECGDIDKLTNIATATENDKLAPLIANELKTGITFPKAMQNATAQLLGDDASVLSNPNDTLAVEYIRAARALHFSPEFIPVKRVGCGHDSAVTDDIFASASAIREYITEGKIELVSKYMPSDAYKILLREAEPEGGFADIENLSTAILAKLRLLNADDIIKTPEVSEGLENKIVAAIASASSLSDIYKSVKSKRYTLARIRRILISAFLGIKDELFNKPVPYIKVLGFNKTGEEIIKFANPSVPLINRNRDYLLLENDAKICFKLQNNAANLYGLAYKNVKPCGRELSEKIIKL